MSGIFNLSVVRKLVQLAAFLFLVYGSTLVGFYLTDKISGTFPALACAYDFQTADYCVLISLQHQVDHRVGTILAAGGAIAGALIPTLITLVTFALLFILLNKAFCGWICPLGFFQEVMTMIGQKLGLATRQNLPETTVQRLRPVKWLILVLLVLVFPLLTGLGFVGHELGSPYCSICPSRILTTLATGDTSQLVVDNTSTGYMALSVFGTFLFGLMVALALKVRQPFCRVCPMLALHAAFRKLGLVRLVKNATPRCEKCGLCAQACPMDIREVHTEMERRNVLFPDCTLCGRCVEFCPDVGVLSLKYAVIPVFKSGPAYFKQRRRMQNSWERFNLLRVLRARDRSAVATEER